MTKYRSLLIFSVLLALSAGLMPACQRKLDKEATKETKLVVMARLPEQRQVINYLYFTGRTEASESVDMKARVSGYLVQIVMRPNTIVRGPENPDVRAASTVGLLANPMGGAALQAAAAQYPGRGRGDVLFVIDPRPYQAALDQAKGQVLLAEAKLTFAKKQYEMAKDVSKINKDAISKLQLETYAASQDEMEAALKAARASLESYKLDLEFTEVTSPIEGRVSRNYLTIGNLVTKDLSSLTSIVSDSPMYVYFDMDEPTYQDIRNMIQKGKIKSFAKGNLPVHVGLATDKDEDNNPTYPHDGSIDFANNKVDPTTGTITVRAACPNHWPDAAKKGKAEGEKTVGRGPLVPGYFVRIQLPLGNPYPALLAPEKALLSEQGKKYLWVLDDKNVPQKKLVTLGPLQADGMRVIAMGLSANERVVTNRLQEIIAGKEVQVAKAK